MLADAGGAAAEEAGEAESGDRKRGHVAESGDTYDFDRANPHLGKKSCVSPCKQGGALGHRVQMD